MSNKEKWKFNNLAYKNIIFVFIVISLMVLLVFLNSISNSNLVNDGVVGITKEDLSAHKLIYLDGDWEFYWNQLLTHENFIYKQTIIIPDAFIKVPGSWNNRALKEIHYPDHGFATYRMIISYPDSIKDPAIRIKRITRAFSLYVNGELLAQGGNVSDQSSGYEPGYNYDIVNLPLNGQKVELILQVANFDYARGGVRESPVFGSRSDLENNKMILLALQLLFLGGVLIFSIYYLLFFIMQKSNKTTLLFSLICLLSSLRAMVWGENPLLVFFPDSSVNVGVYINYITGYNMMPMIILLVMSIFPLEANKKSLIFFFTPNLFFYALLFTSPGTMSQFNSQFYILMVFQMVFVMFILIKAVLKKRESAKIIFIAITMMILTIIFDVLTYIGLGNHNLPYLTLFGIFMIILLMSLVQARQQSITNKKLLCYSENIVEYARLKDKVMATEMSFLQAQIKPHFLYNALNAIANVCEKDGDKAAKLILDLAVYLRGSLEFNQLDKFSTIEKELEFVTTYFNIEQARFGNKIKLLMDVDLPNSYKMPILVLQPLVENAVRHGISKKVTGGFIKISIKSFNNGALIEIQDDGQGIPEEKLGEILDEGIDKKGVGLLNINYRLLMLYGKGLLVRSIPGEGTNVSFIIPEEEKSL